MGANPGWGPAGGGGFLQVLGIIYLIKVIRRRRERRRLAQAGPGAGDHPGAGDGPGAS